MSAISFLPLSHYINNILEINNEDFRETIGNLLEEKQDQIYTKLAELRAILEEELTEIEEVMSDKDFEELKRKVSVLSYKKGELTEQELELRQTFRKEYNRRNLR